MQVVYCARGRTPEEAKIVEEQGVKRLAVELQVSVSCAASVCVLSFVYFGLHHLG